MARPWRSGLLLALAYLARLEAIYLGVTLLVVGCAGRAIGSAASSAWPPPSPGSERLSPCRGGSGTRWSFGTPLPGQVTDNLFLTRNEQIFAYLDQPTLDAFLRPGPGHDPRQRRGRPVAQRLRRAHRARRAGGRARRARGRRGACGCVAGTGIDREIFTSPLAALLIYGTLTFLLTGVLFPIATLWGTFEHASGPLLVGLIVAALLGGDALVAWIQARRGWQRNNTWLAPFAVLALAVPLAVVQVTIARQADGR